MADRTGNKFADVILKERAKMIAENEEWKDPNSSKNLRMASLRERISQWTVKVQDEEKSIAEWEQKIDRYQRDYLANDHPTDSHQKRAVERWRSTIKDRRYTFNVWKQKTDWNKLTLESMARRKTMCALQCDRFVR